MFWNAKNGCVRIGDADMNYVSFGSGSDNLIMLPGLGDGLTTVKGMAFPIALLYRMYAKAYKVFIFSRRNDFERRLFYKRYGKRPSGSHENAWYKKC